MAFININSRPAINAACDLFTLPPTQRAVDQGYFQEFRPISSLDSDEAPIEFSIPPTGNEYLDLSHTKLKIRVKILTDKNESLTEAHKVSPVNNFLHSLFSNVQIELNNKTITTQSGNYAYRAILENLLNYGSEAKDTHLTSSLFYKDSGSIEAGADNTGYVKRSKFALSGEFDMEGLIHSDIFNSNKYMLNGVQMLIKLYKSRPEFSLMTIGTDNNKYRIKIMDAVLSIRRLKMATPLLIAHANTLMKHSAKYPITRVDVKNVTIPKDIQNITMENIVLGQAPQRISIAFVDSASFNGSFKLNPFNFQHFDHNYLSVATDASVHIQPLKPNYVDKLYVSAYNTLFNATGIAHSDSGSNISRDEFANGFNISVFDLTPDISSHEAHYSQPSTGSLRVEVQFAKALAKPVTAIIFLEFNNVIEIDKFRAVTTDYST